MKTINHLYHLFLITAAGAALIFLSGCGPSSGPSDAGKNSPTPGVPAASSPTRASAPATGRVIEITADDSMKFSVTEVRAKPGEALSIILKNIGTMPKLSMGHNLVVLAAGLDPVTFANDAAQAVKTDYIPAKYKSRIIASTKLLGPGESDTTTFKAPNMPGRYPFICSYPGHFQVGMRGELIVE
ncbi:azurin [Opitutaceae bacterium TAV4]|nr:azurin [Opitutaceae bacterium TAV4]RRK02065.1 azurin [Opitutaceae bacterium TAV3]